MLYGDFLKNLSTCPFCENRQERILENKHAYLTYALVPVSKHHLMVVPHRHVESLTDITLEEMAHVNMLEIKALKTLLKLGHGNIVLLVREAKHKDKSIDHLHFHLMPEFSLVDRDIDPKEKKILTESEIKETIEEIKKVL